MRFHKTVSALVWLIRSLRAIATVLRSGPRIVGPPLTRREDAATSPRKNGERLSQHVGGEKDYSTNVTVSATLAREVR
jgi:hypothetical protein